MATPADIAIRQQVYLERLKSGLVSATAESQESLRKRTREIMSLIEKDNFGTLTRKELDVLLFRLQDAHVSVMGTVMTDFAAGLPQIAALAMGLEADSLSRHLLDAPKFNMPTAKAAYQRALAQPIQATGDLLKPFIEDWPKAAAAKVNKAVRVGWAQGKTTRQMTRELVGTATDPGLVVDISRKNMSAVINTATQHVATSARMDFYEQNADVVKQYQWVSTLDRRTTAQCQSLDGRIFDAGKGPLPPIHINCRSTTVPVLGPEWKWLEEGATRASAGPVPGYVPASFNYYDWLGKQPARFQDIAIGPVRGKLFRDGGLSADKFAQLNLGRDFQPLTLSEMKKLEPDAFKRAGL